MEDNLVNSINEYMLLKAQEKDVCAFLHPDCEKEKKWPCAYHKQDPDSFCPLAERNKKIAKAENISEDKLAEMEKIRSHAGQTGRGNNERMKARAQGKLHKAEDNMDDNISKAKHGSHRDPDKQARSPVERAAERGGKDSDSGRTDWDTFLGGRGAAKPGSPTPKGHFPKEGPNGGYSHPTGEPWPKLKWGHTESYKSLVKAIDNLIEKAEKKISTDDYARYSQHPNEIPQKLRKKEKRSFDPDSNNKNNPT
jgi:hypothetical protein